jgi:hypothetical protein
MSSMVLFEIDRQAQIAEKEGNFYDQYREKQSGREK